MTDIKNLKENITNLGRIVSEGNKIEDIEVSTKTIIASTNILIDLDKFFKYMPITNYTPIEKKRGRKKKTFTEVKPDILPEGSIISIQKGPNKRGIIVKKTKKKTEVLTYFLHSTTIVISLDENKFINVKVSANGKFQITGCKYDEHTFKTMMYIYRHIKNTEMIIGESIIQYVDNTEVKDVTNKEGESPLREFKIVFNTVMQNMDYNIGFDISREKLNTFINNKTNFTSIYEGSIGTGVNIKIESRYPYEEHLTRMKIKYNPKEMSEEISYDKMINKEFIENELEYDEFYDETEYEYNSSELQEIKKIKEDLSNEDLKKKKAKKEKYHTFLVFASGSIIMSSRGPIMKEIFKELVEMLIEHKAEIQEQIAE